MSLFKIGHTTHHFDTLNSTNNYAANVFKKEHIKCGTVILADNQTDGRGQRDNKWFSEPYSNLTFSFVLDNNKLDINRPLKPILITSLALINFFKSVNITAKIKWPNDIMINDLKIAGILIENFYSGKQLNFSVIGIGININQENFNDLPATSLKSIKKKEIPLNNAFESVIYQLNLAFESYHKIQFNEVLKIYNSQLWKKEEVVDYYLAASKQRHQGKIMGANENGELIIKSDNELKSYKNGEVKFNTAAKL